MPDRYSAEPLAVVFSISTETFDGTLELKIEVSKA